MRLALLDVDNIQEKSFVLLRPNGTDDYLFVLFKSPATVYSAGEYVCVDRGNWILHDIHAKQHYFPNAGLEFLHDFIHLQPENAKEEALLSQITKGVAMTSTRTDSISAILTEIKKEKLRSGSENSRRILGLLVESFLYQLKEDSLIPSNGLSRQLFIEISQIRQEIYDDPARDWNIGYLCSRLHISRSYFLHQYKALFSVSVMNDVIRSRILMAQILLSNSKLMVCEIAERCGYRNIEHFIRQFKAETGQTPSSYRKSFADSKEKSISVHDRTL